MYSIVLVFIAFVCFINCTFSAVLPVPFKQCSSMNTGEIHSVRVNAPCSDSYCTFYKGRDALLSFDFTLKKKVLKVRAKVIATIGTIDHDFQLPNPDACTQLSCPLPPNVKHTYSNSMFVSPIYPSVKINQMRYYLIDGKGRELACISVPVMITEQN